MSAGNYSIKTIEWQGDEVVMIDQRILPLDEEYIHHTTWQEVGDSIKTMVIRGAPAIGVATAMGMALAAMQSGATTQEDLKRDLDEAAKGLFATRPTAYNLGWALEQRRRSTTSPATLTRSAPGSRRVRRRSSTKTSPCASPWASTRRRFSPRAPASSRIATPALWRRPATARRLGSSARFSSGIRRSSVFADETRPFLQGARLTAWELQQEGIPCTLITDNMSGYFFKDGEIDAVVVGSDRIAGNGDVANKIGTYTVSVLAKEHGVPFYVAAPTSTVDLSLTDGSQIPIEERDPAEVTHCGSRQIAPTGIGVRNPAFDVTPHQNVAAIITEMGVHREPYTESLAAAKKGK